MKNESLQHGDRVVVLPVHDILLEYGKQPRSDGTIGDFTTGMQKFCGKTATITSVIGQTMYGQAFRLTFDGDNFPAPYRFYDYCVKSLSHDESLFYDENADLWNQLLS